MRVIVMPVRPTTPPTVGGGRRSSTRRLLVPLVLFAALVGAPRAALAEGCEGCDGPSVAYLQQHAGLALQVRGDDDLGYSRDYLLTDAGECTATLVEPPEVTRVAAWLVLRGQGEVWYCPHSKSEDTVTVEAARTDSTEWSLTVTSGIKAKGLVASVELEVESGRSGGVAIREVTRVSKTITPGYCRRIGWRGYFEVGYYKVEAQFKFSQRWAWWTKNRLTGAEVHQKGDVFMDCGTGTLELERTAPVAGYFDLSQGACEATECAGVQPKQLGFFPALPPHLPDPHDDEPTTAPQTSEGEEDGAGEPEPEDPAPPPPTSGELEDPPTGGDGDSEEPEDPPTGPLPDPLAE